MNRQSSSMAHFRHRLRAGILRAGVFTVALALAPGSGALAQDAIEAALAAPPEIEGVTLASLPFLTEFYAARDGTPLWTDDRAEALFEILNDGLDHGFRPQDVHLPRLYDLHDARQSGDAADGLAFELAASDAMVRLLHHLVFGKVDPERLDAHWNFSRPVLGDDPARSLNAFIEDTGVAAVLPALEPTNANYNALKSALETYRLIQIDGGWPVIPDGPALKPGMRDARVQTIRQRLAAEGVLSPQGIEFLSATPEDSPAGPSDPDLYDPSLAADVARFQARLGLEADGVIGPRTLTALNRTVEERIDQLRLSLERARWLVRGLGDDFVLVNIAGARTYVVRDGALVWTTRSITGSAYRKTPVFRDDIKYMEFNPTWTVPASILKKDKLPKIRRDPGYLARHGYSVIAPDGTPVSPASVNWASDDPGIKLVQRPGPDNALGLVKFMFPNDYAVYLHDTNDRTLFDRNERNLSSGCVRVEDPFLLADLLMMGDPDWSRAKMEAILASGQTTRINLPEPMPVLLTYWTAWVEDGEVHFREDIYDRDGAVLAALNAPYRGASQ
ncbi:MAG: L,D-transpeptidase family protein [Pseudomonadota bacterium]